MSDSSNLIGRILRRSVTGSAGSAISDDLAELAKRDELDALVDAATFHRVSNYLYVNGRESEGVEREVAGRVAASYELSVLNHLRVLAELTELSRILDSTGIPWLVIKGPVLAVHRYPRFDLRGYTDLDVVIQPSAFPEAIALLERHGYQLLDSNWLLLQSELKGELHLNSPRGVLVDIHWDLINDRQVRRVFRVRSEDLFESSRRIRIGNTVIPANGPSEDLVYLATHACLAGGERLVWMKDIHHAASLEEVDWDRVRELAHMWGVAPLLFVMLDRTRRVLRLPRMQGEIDNLGGDSYWTRLIRWVDRISPPETIRTQGSPSRIAARATRSTPLRSTIELTRRSLSWVLNRPGLGKELEDEATLLRGSALVPSGDSHDRDAYFQSVSRGGR